MHLKTLTLKGFKSFSEPASIRLERGVTAVVGPNGSGKSNVVDAVAWVLGAQAPSSVRSVRMEDVIFAGTDLKPALGRAEVSLTIDNSDGALPVDLSEVRITRTLFRGGESSYAMNGRPCRLLDIVELLSDTGVGRQQHMIVSQSQIDAVLNARPEDRRELIEEAAGVLKYRKRRERAERRLHSTDGDLIRINDLVREVRRQLRPLQKQAEAARHHADLVAELQNLRIHLAGQGILGLRSQLRELRERSGSRAEVAAVLRAELEELGDETVDCEQRLALHGVEDHSEQLARLEGLRARAGGLRAVVGERLRSIERERAVLADNDLAAGLVAEIESCRQGIEAVVVSEAEEAPARSELVRLQVALEADQADHRAAWGEWPDESPVPGAKAAEARGELTALRGAIDGYESERRRQNERLNDLSGRLRTLEQEVDYHRPELARRRDETKTLREASAEAEAALASANRQIEAAVEVLAESEAELRHWAARHEALTMADESSDPAVLEGLAADGILGALADLVEVDRGAEAAFAAAVGDAVGAVVVRDAAAAQRVLGRLEARTAGAAVIALQNIVAGDPSSVPGSTVPSGTARLRDRVRSNDPGVARLLDTLLATTVIVDSDWRGAADVAALRPDLVVVTAAGDRFSARGWRLGAHSAAGVRAALIEATERAEAADAARTSAAEIVEQARAALAERQADKERLGQWLHEVEQAAAAAAEALGQADADRRNLQSAAAALRDHMGEIAGRLERSAVRRSEIEACLPELEASEARDLERGRQVTQARAELDRRSSDLAASAYEQRVRDAELVQRRDMLEARLAELTERLARYETSRVSTEDRLAGLERQRAVLEMLGAALAALTVTLDAGLSRIREVRRRHSEQARALATSLDGLRRRFSDVEGRLDELRRVASVDDVEEARLRTLLQGVVERLRDDYGLSPAEVQSAAAPTLIEGLDVAQRVEQLCSELELMGPVNPLALAEFQELDERHELLSGQLEDIRAARRDLNRVIRSIDAEIRTVLSAAFVDVAANFELLFEALFPGGEGHLSLNDPDDLLNTGVEISAKPSGKNVKRLSLLSGGERTLAALAFLFAVFRSRPSPFYLLDEVEAALDDVNLHRFLKLVDEFRADAQLVIVTHQKRTMEAADCLHGVSMKPGGSSVVVSERVSEAA